MSKLRITVNGQPHEFAEALSLTMLLEHFSIPSATVVIELNGSIVQRAQFGEQRIAEGDSLELVTIVGGG